MKFIEDRNISLQGESVLKEKREPNSGIMYNKSDKILKSGNINCPRKKISSHIMPPCYMNSIVPYFPQGFSTMYRQQGAGNMNKHLTSMHRQDDLLPLFLLGLDAYAFSDYDYDYGYDYDYDYYYPPYYYNHYPYYPYY